MTNSSNSGSQGDSKTSEGSSGGYTPPVDKGLDIPFKKSEEPKPQPQKPIEKRTD